MKDDEQPEVTSCARADELKIQNRKCIYTKKRDIDIEWAKTV